MAGEGRLPSVPGGDECDLQMALGKMLDSAGTPLHHRHRPGQVKVEVVDLRR